MHDRSVRTTVEIADDKLIKLRKLAAERGERGYSALIDEALERFLEPSAEDPEIAQRRRQVAAIHAAAGTISDAEADEMLKSVRESRKNWREPWSTRTS